MNSFVANYLIRLRVVTHVGVGPVERLPVPPYRSDSPAIEMILMLVEGLEQSSGADEDAYIELQVRIAVLYELEGPEWRHIVSTFPLVDERIREASIKRFDNLRS
jgi:hypothetical protein